ncbi:hypothetical protein Dsin_021320 [Dipteronia sinensis]|uniref:Uncharacterized protein n=1 Tax=Dipteronia sinensis TaxID=43782 RepID=A0AAE0DYQ6_9ROSI|nr:hypothetical protein Dsin_021320 [Dipteronia sinensis]
MVFNGKKTNLVLSLDTVTFRLAWWLKIHGCGSNEALTLLLLDITERYVDKHIVKFTKSPLINDDLMFNVDCSSSGSLGVARGSQGCWRLFLQRLKGLSIKFMHRGLNSFADSLAKMGSRDYEDRLEWGNT